MRSAAIAIIGDELGSNRKTDEPQIRYNRVGKFTRAPDALHGVL